MIPRSHDTMPLLLDTYNILHITGVLPPELAGVDVQGLIRLIGRSRYAREAIVLVCDGEPAAQVQGSNRGGSLPGRGAGMPPVEGEEPPAVTRVTGAAGVSGAPGEGAKTARGTIRVLYAGRGQTADDLIAHMVSVSTAPRRLAVVSSDNQVLRNARRRQCRTLRSEEFLRQLAADIATGERAAPPAPQRPPAAPMSDEQVRCWRSVFGVENDEQTLAALTPREEARKPEDLVDAPTAAAAALEPASGTIPATVLEEAERLVAEHERGDHRGAG